MPNAAKCISQPNLKGISVTTIRQFIIVTTMSILSVSTAAADTPPNSEPLDLVPQDARMPSDPTAPKDLPPIEKSEAGQAAAAPSESEKSGGFLLWPEPAKLTGPLATDRPGFADTTSVMPRGHAQLELGYTYTADREDGTRVRDHALTQTNLRVGLLDNLELRTLWGGYSMTTSRFEMVTPGGRTIRTTDRDDGATDMTLGLRSQILKNKGYIPDLTFLTNLSLPVGTNSKTVGDVVPDLRLAYGWALTDKLRLYGVGIAAAGVSDNERFFQAAGSAGLSYALTDRLGTFVEYYGTYPARDQEDCAHNADGGFSFLINDNCQLDISAGLGLNDQAPDYFFSTGIAFRF